MLVGKFPTPARALPLFLAIVSALWYCTRAMCQEECAATCQGVEVVEFYRDYTPRRSYAPYVCDLLKCVPKQNLAGLDRVVLTDAAGQPRRERRKKTYSRKRKVSLIEAYGFYQPAWHHDRAHIQLYIDRIFPPPRVEPTRYMRFISPLMRPAYIRASLGRVLYHEIGHHIHAEQRPEHREAENVADMYMFRLMKRLLIRRFYFLPPAILAVLMAPGFWKSMVTPPHK